MQQRVRHEVTPHLFRGTDLGVVTLQGAGDLDQPFAAGDEGDYLVIHFVNSDPDGSELTPLIVIPMLWLAGRRRAAATAAGTFAGCAAAALVVLPGDSWRFWTAEVFHVSRLGYITSVGNQSLNGALMRLDLAAPARSLLVLAIGGAVAALALHRAARSARAGDWLTAMTVVGAASVVLSPVSWTHHQIWLVLAALLPVRNRAWAVVVLAVMLLPVTALGPPLFSEARLLLAVAIAALVPLTVPGRAPSADVKRGWRTPRRPQRTADTVA